MGCKTSSKICLRDSINAKPAQVRAQASLPHLFWQLTNQWLQSKAIHAVSSYEWLVVEVGKGSLDSHLSWSETTGEQPTSVHRLVSWATNSVH